MFEMQRVPIEMAADRHIHPNYSFDAEGTLDEYCEAALNACILEICFTTHYDADPRSIEREGFIVIEGKREPVSDDAVKVYVDDIARVHQEYGLLGLMVRPGIEFGWFDDCPKEVERLRSKFKLDYCLGAVHNLDSYCICWKDDVEKMSTAWSLDRLADEYFARLDRCAASGVFDSLAHLDIYRRFGREYYGPEIDHIHRGRIEKLFATMKAHGVGYEVNTSAIRHGHHEYYPCMEIVNLAREAGVTMRALGSDAHHPSQLGLDFEAASAMAYELFPYVDE